MWITSCRSILRLSILNHVYSHEVKDILNVFQDAYVSSIKNSIKSKLASWFLASLVKLSIHLWPFCASKSIILCYFYSTRGLVSFLALHIKGWRILLSAYMFIIEITEQLLPKIWMPDLENLIRKHKCLMPNHSTIHSESIYFAYHYRIDLDNLYLTYYVCLPVLDFIGLKCFHSITSLIWIQLCVWNIVFLQIICHFKFC